METTKPPFEEGWVALLSNKGFGLFLPVFCYSMFVELFYNEVIKICKIPQD